MRTLRFLVSYHNKACMKSNRFVMPFAALIIFLFFSYTIAPLGVVDSFALSMVCLFFLMVWNGLIYNDVEPPVSEQLLILKTRSAVKFYMSKVLCLALMGVVEGAIAVIFPVMQNMLNHFHLYTRPLTWQDVLMALFLHFFAAFAGAATGSLLHPRIMRDRKGAVLLTFLIALMGLVKIGINDKIPLTRWVTWVFPPVSDMVKTFTGMDYFTWASVLKVSGMLIAYGFVLTGIQVYFLVKKKF